MDITRASSADENTAAVGLHANDASHQSVCEKGQPCLQSPECLNHNALSSCGTDPDLENQTRVVKGSQKFRRLGWKRLTVVLFVEAIALGSLGLPAAFATLGMVGGIVSSVGIGLIATYASYEVGAVKIKYPHVEHYGDIGRLVLGEWGFWIITVIFVIALTLNVGSHCVTGIIALVHISQSDICTVIFGLISAIILLLLAIPPSFADIAILGYIDVVSILTAIGITIIATGIQSTQDHTDGKLPTSDWSAWPKKDVNFTTGMIAINNIVFAYSFAPGLPSFMSEMHNPKEYTKTVYTLGTFQIGLYTLIGSLVYAFVGQNVQSPALLSAGPLISRIAFGVALPVIFISGSINVSVLGRYLHGSVFRHSVLRYVNTKMGWITWLTLVTILVFVAWVVAEAIPVFSTIVSICAALLNSGLCFYFPSIMWLVLVRDGFWLNQIPRAFYNAIVFLFGVGVLVCGMYANVATLVSYKRSQLFILVCLPFEQIQESRDGITGRPFSCSKSST